MLIDIYYQSDYVRLANHINNVTNANWLPIIIDCITLRIGMFLHGRETCLRRDMSLCGHDPRRGMPLRRHVSLLI